MTSITYGNILLSRVIEAKRHSINQNPDSARVEVSDLFSFSDHRILLQQISLKSAGQALVQTYYINGERMNEQEYLSLLNTWGSLTQSSNKI